MQLPLAGLRIFEVASGPAAGLATITLADFGAEVIRIEPAAGDPYAALPSYPMWTRGKLVVRLDLDDPANLRRLRTLVLDTADALVTTLPVAKLAACDLEAAALHAERPDLVIGRIDGWVDRTREVSHAGIEGPVAARFGRMLSFEGAASRSGPCYPALQVGVHAAAQTVTTALLAALHARSVSGRGAAFETSLCRGMLPYDLAGLLTEQLAARGIIERPEGRQDPLRTLPRIYYHAARTRDGRWIQFGNLLPHLERNFYRAVGIEVPEGGVPSGGEALEAFRDRLLAHIETRDLDDWMALLVRDGGVVAHAYQTTQQALDDADLVNNGHVAAEGTMRQLGPIATLVRTPGAAARPAVHATLADLPLRTRAGLDRSPPTGATRRPLEGITVVEAATIIAAPLGAATLADLGARVIKLEPLEGDPFRSMMHGIGAGKCNTGKESICLDLKSADGQAIARRLVARADVFIHNYRPGVPEKLGLGYATLARENAGLVYLSVNGYGPSGPGAHRPSTHPIPGAALGGVDWQMGGLPGPGPMTLAEIREITRRLFRANEVNPDPNTSMVVATAATLALLTRTRTGTGQAVFVDMFGANAWANWDDFLSYPGKAPRASLDPELLGLEPGYRLYRCRSGWVFLAVLDEAGWERLDSRDPDVLAARFLEDDADAWEERLDGGGLACVRADRGWPADYLLGDPECREQELVVPAEHPQWGPYLRHGPMALFERGGTYPGGSVAGDSTRSLLEELGHTPQEIARLLADGIVRG